MPLHFKFSNPRNIKLHFRLSDHVHAALTKSICTHFDIDFYIDYISKPTTQVFS